VTTGRYVSKVRTRLVRNVIAGILLLIAICTLMFGTGFDATADRPIWRESVITYRTPPVPSTFDRQITYLSKRHPGETETDDGPTEYLRYHQIAWDECIYYFYRDWPYGDSPAWSAAETPGKWGPWVIGAPGHINDARRDGWYNAASQLRALLETTEPETLRRELPERHLLVKLTHGIVTGSLVVAAFLLIRAGKKHNNMVNRSGEPSGI